MKGVVKFFPSFSGEICLPLPWGLCTRCSRPPGRASKLCRPRSRACLTVWSGSAESEEPGCSRRKKRAVDRCRSAWTSMRPSSPAPFISRQKRSGAKGRSQSGTEAASGTTGRAKRSGPCVKAHRESRVPDRADLWLSPHRRRQVFVPDPQKSRFRQCTALAVQKSCENSAGKNASEALLSRSEAVTGNAGQDATSGCEKPG